MPTRIGTWRRRVALAVFGIVSTGARLIDIDTGFVSGGVVTQ